MLGQLGHPGNSFRWKYDNVDVPAGTPGTGVAVGTSNAEGSWVQIASSGNIAQDVYLFTLSFSNYAVSGANLNCCLDVGVDPAGGTSYVEVIQNIICGKAGSPTRENCAYFVFPLFIKAGSSVAVRASSSYTVAVNARVQMTFYGRPTRPDLVRVGQYAEGVGTITNNVGASFTPANGSEGSWASLGTTTRPCWWWQLGVDINAAAISVQYTHVDLAVGDGSNYDIIIENYPIFAYGTAEILSRFYHHRQLLEGYWEVPAGATLYVRGRCSTTITAGYNARAIGIGG